MAAPSEIRSETLKQLRQAFLEMCSPEWDLALSEKPKEVQREAALEFARVQRARLRLENAELAGIRDKLLENDAELEEGRKRVQAALKHLERVENVLKAISGLLGVVARVVALA